jgi:hypothetical protein
VWRPAAPEPARLADSVLNLFGAGPAAPPPRAEPQAPPPRPRAASRQGGGEQGAEKPLHGLEALLPPEDIPTGGTKRGERRQPANVEKNFFEKLFGG